ncbi:MAG: AAA family ATPase [Alphaproteobacteria bacterium]|nr:AAA family ATPase [Alphaproteobacteria bacterium]
MRFETLELVRYGHFDSRSLEFQKSGIPGRETDLQIIYGPNEAGKSTIREAISDLLFRFHNQSKMGFAAQGMLKVGARATVAQSQVEAYRLKKHRDDMVDVSDRPLADNPFAAVVDGFDRAEFERTFSVNREQLDAGGEAISRGEGSLGELLFAGTTGLQDLPARLDAMNEQAAAIWSGKHSATAKVLSNQIKEIDAKIRDLQTSNNAYQSTRKELEAQNGAFEQAKEEFVRLGAQIARIQGRLSAFRPYRDRLRALNDLETLGEGEVASEADQDRLNGVVQDMSALQARAAAASENRATLQEQLAAIPQPDSVTLHRAAIEDFAASAIMIRDRRQALPNRKDEEKEAQDKIERVLGELDVAIEGGGADLGLTPQEVSHLSGLIKLHTETNSALHAAERELDSARQSLEAASAELDSIEEAADPSALAALLKASRERNLVTDQLENAKSQEMLREELQITLGGVGIGIEFAGWLDTLELPHHGDVEDLQRRYEEARSEVGRIQSDIARRRDIHVNAEERIQSFGDMARSSDSDLKALLTARDALIAEFNGPLTADEVADLRARLSGAVADTDRVFEDRIRHADRLSEVNAAMRDRDREKVAMNRLAKELETAQDGQAGVDKEIADLIPDEVNVSGISGLRRLIEAKVSVSSSLRKIETRKRESKALQEAAAEHVAGLTEALSAVGASVPAEMKLSALQNLAEQCVEELKEHQRKRESALKAKATAVATVKKRQSELSEATETVETWKADFEAALRETWIPQDSGHDQVSGILNRLPDLSGARADLKTARRRIEQIEVDEAGVKEGFEAFLDATDLQAPEDLHGADFLLVIDQLKSRLDAADARDRSVADLEERIAGFDESLGQLKVKAEEKRSELADLAAKFGETEFSDLMLAVRDGVKRAGLNNTVGECEREIVEELSATSIEEALKMLDDSDEDELNTEREQLKAELDQVMARRDSAGQAAAVARGAFEKMSGSDEIARLQQEREILASDLVEQIADYTRIRAGERALSWALGRYRQENKGPMLEAAGRFFARMTQSRYPELVTQPGDKGDKLAARAKDGSLKLVEALSEGTRHQLFLALRMAGYLELARARQAPPLILDDILSSSDDTRTGAMLEALADLAEEAQVIVLTHHSHVLRIADDAVGGRHAVVRLSAE